MLHRSALSVTKIDMNGLAINHKPPEYEDMDAKYDDVTILKWNEGWKCPIRYSLRLVYLAFTNQFPYRKTYPTLTAASPIIGV